MKRFLTPLFALVLLVSTPVAHAQGAAGLNLSDNGTVTGGGGLSLPGSGAPAANTIGNVNTANTVVSQNSGDSSAGAAALANNSNNLTSIKNATGSATAKTNDPNANKTGNYQGSNNKVEENSYDGIMMKIMSLFAWLLGVAILTLDNVVYYTVVHMGNYISGLTAIGTVWRILRDVGNIVLIFGFLAIGVTVILGVDGFGYSKKMLPMLLVAAVFLNFSLFFSEAVIDAGNLFATVFYTQINNGQDAAPSNPITDASSHAGISGAIMNQLGLASIYGAAVNSKSSGGYVQSVFSPGNPWFIGFMGILLFLVAAFVMFSLAFMLVGRFVYLVFLIVLAPIGFAGLAVPKLEGTAKWWWGALFEQTITAPILLLLLYVALAVITDAHFLTGFANGANVGGGWTGLFGATPNTAAFGSLMMSFMVAMGLLLLVTITAKNMGAVGAKAVTKFGSSALSGATKFAGRTAVGGARLGARYTAGYGANKLSQKVMTSSFGQTQLGRITAQTLAKGGKGYKDAKEKSAKSHEEYKKSVEKALEEKHAPAVVSATKERGQIEQKIDEAKKDYEKEVKDAKPVVDELKRLENLTKKLGEEREKADSDLANARKVTDTSKPETFEEVKRLIEVKKKLDADSQEAQSNFAKAKEEAVPFQKIMEEAEKKRDAIIKPLAKEGPGGEASPLKKAQDREKEATDELANAKKKAAIAYAESAEKNLLWLAGPGGDLAANKIIKDTFKKMNDKEKLLAEMEKVFKKEKEASEDATEASVKATKAKEGLTKKTNEEADH